MAVPSSGTLSLASIWNEVTESDYNANAHGSGEDCSLKELETGVYDAINTNNSASNRPDGSAPHTMDEWYSYNHDEPSPFSLGSNLYSFDDQSSSAGSTNGALWTPAGTHSSWVNGQSAVYQPPAGKGGVSTAGYWLTGFGTAMGWYIEYNATGSGSTGPSGAANSDTTHSTATSTRYLYTETSSGNGAKGFVCRSPGVNWYSYMTDQTDNDLYLEFYSHRYGSSLNTASSWTRVYVDDEATSNDTRGTQIYETTGQTQASGSANWIKVEDNINTQCRNNNTYYFYFVTDGNSTSWPTYRGDAAIDRVGVKEVSGAITCFAEGTLIRMADGSWKPIEQMTGKDTILSYNFDTKQTEADRVIKAHKTRSDNLRTITFEDGSTLRATIDHPIYVEDKGWCSIEPDLSMGQGQWGKGGGRDRGARALGEYDKYKGHNELVGEVKQLEKGDKAYNLLNGTLEPVRIASLGEYSTRRRDVYTFTKLEKNIGYFADNILVGVYGKN